VAEIMFHVPEIICPDCAGVVEDLTRAVVGVHEVIFDYETDCIRVEYDDSLTTVEAIRGPLDYRGYIKD
jgi:copper chaperone CopZ